MCAKQECLSENYYDSCSLYITMLSRDSREGGTDNTWLSYPGQIYYLPQTLLIISFILLSSVINLDSSLIKYPDVVNYLQLVLAFWYGNNGSDSGCYLHLAVLLLQREFYLQQLSLNHKTIHLYQLCLSRLHFKACRLFDTKD